MNITFDPANTHAPQAARKALAVGLLASLLAACGGAGGDAAMPTTAALSSTAPESTLLGTGSPLLPPALTIPTAGGVVTYFKQKLLEDAANTARIAVSGNPVTSPGFIGSDTELTGINTSTSAGAVLASASSGAVQFASSTLQERGVDEADWVKTDGSFVYGLSQAYTNVAGKFIAPVLQAQRRLADGQLQSVGSISLPGDVKYAGMYLVGAASRIAVVSQKIDYSDSVVLPMPMPMSMPMPITTPTSIQPTPDVQKTVSSQTGTVAIFATDFASVTSLPGTFKPPTVTTDIDLLPTPTAGALTANLSINNRIRIDGSLVGSRVIGNTLYVVSTWQPDLNVYLMPNATAAQTQAKLASLSAAEILPTIRIDGAPAQPLVAESDCYVQTGNASSQRQVTTITAFNLASSSLQRSSRCFLGGSQAIYMSPAAVYLASSRFFDERSVVFAPPAGSKTDIHKFALAGQNIDYRGSGEVAGHFGWDADKNAYRMSEHNGDLRVLTFTGELGWSINRNGTSASAVAAPAASPATLSVLRETTGTTPNSSSLQVIATLPNAQRPAAIGKPGEQIYAVQFVGPKAYVVTFRRTDPLYVLDLSNPLDPKTVGELEIPGYSDYLFPLGDSLLLGVGKDANTTGVVQGVKVALMDVSDPAKPSIRSSLVLGSRFSASALDTSSRGINMFQQGNTFRIALPVVLREPRTASTTGFYGPTTQGLARFEVDTQARTLVTKPMLTRLTPTSLTDNWQYDIAYERSVQIESFVYYLSGGTFRAASW